MPGPCSDSYDPEFSTSANAALVREAVTAVRDRVSAAIGSERLMNVMDLVTMPETPGFDTVPFTLSFTERELRILRFALNREINSI